MATYTFQLKDGSCGITDGAGVDLPDREHARRYAHDVARELMSGREAETRFWPLDVYEDNNERILEIPFASIDRTLDHLVQNCERLWRDCAIVVDPLKKPIMRLGSRAANHERSWRSRATNPTSRPMRAKGP